MEKLSNLKGRFEYLGKSMPIEFKNICKLEKFQDKIRNRKERPYRYFETISKFLKYDYKGDLPKTPMGVAQILGRRYGYEPYVCDLFYLSEEGFKNVYPEKYADFFENQSQKDKEFIFQMCDWGVRSVFEHKQDVESGHIIEDMISYHTKGILSPNKNASGRSSGKVTTACDFIFTNPKKEGYSVISVPVELKTKWEWSLKENEIIQMRGNMNEVLKSQGMILAVYAKLNKAVLIDPIGKQYTITKGKMANGKECDEIHIDKSYIVDFVFWDKEDVKKMMHMIYDQYKRRN